MRRFFHQFEPGGLVDVPGGHQHVVGPQHHAAVAPGGGELQAFVHQPPAQAQATRRRLHVQHAQLGGLLVLPHHEHRAHHLALAFCHPAAFAVGLELAHELTGNFGHQGFKGPVPAVFLGIQPRLPVHDPAHVAGFRVAQREAAIKWLVAQQAADARHGAHQLSPIALRQRFEQPGDLIGRGLVERGDDLAAVAGQRQLQALGVVGRRSPFEEPVSFQPGHQPAQVAGVHAQQFPQFARRRRCIGRCMAHLEEHPCLRQREAGSQQMFVERPHQPCVETVEFPDGAGLGFESHVCFILPKATCIKRRHPVQPSWLLNRERAALVAVPGRRRSGYVPAGQ